MTVLEPGHPQRHVLAASGAGRRSWLQGERLHTTTDSSPVSEARALVGEHGAYIWRTLRLLGVRPADLDDISQEVLLVAIRRRHTFDGRASLRAWIRGICVRKAAAYRRSARVRREVVGHTLPELTAPDRPDDSVAHGRQLQRLGEALEDLNELQRATFVLFEVEGLTMKEVADALGCPLQTAYARHRSARARVIAHMRRTQLVVGPPVMHIPDIDQRRGA